MEPTEYKTLNPDGKAVLKAAEYLPPHELPDEAYPLRLITGRTLYQFHTRTKTGRAPELQAAAPEVWLEVSARDAEDLGIAEGDLVEVTTPRGSVRAQARVSGIRPGVVFLPFHYGYWDTSGGHEPESDGAGRAANELTITDWDPASKQPIFKTAAARLARLGTGEGPAPAPTTTASAPVRDIARIATDYGENLDPEVDAELPLMRKLREKGGQLLGRDADAGLLLLRDLRHILTQATGASADWEMVAQAAQGIKHHDLLALAESCHPDTLRQARWANAMIRQSSTQILVS